MNPKLKKILGLILISVLLLAVVPFNGMATESEKKDVAELYVTSW